MANDPLSNMVMALNNVPEAQPPGNVTYSLGYPHTPHQTTMPDLGSALKAQQNMQNILNLPTTLHGRGSMLDGPPMHLAGDVVKPDVYQQHLINDDVMSKVLSPQAMGAWSVRQAGQRPANVLPINPTTLDYMSSIRR